MRWVVRVGVLLGVALVSSCATRLWVWSETWTIAPVPLTSGLPREIAAIPAAFDARVKARFPIGTSVAAMALELQREKFVRQDWDDRPGQAHVAQRYDGGAPACGLTASVSWTSDDSGRLTYIKGDYRAVCL